MELLPVLLRSGVCQAQHQRGAGGLHAAQQSNAGTRMIWFLRIAFGCVLVTMLCVTSWAGLQCALWKTPQAVVTHPWFIATLFDTYFGFLTFYIWLAYKETGWFARVGWLVAIVFLGNIAMSLYMLIALSRLPADAGVEQVLLRRTK
jgi:hypothetical protein